MHNPFGFLVLFVFHPTVLKPDLDLTLSQVEKVCHLHTARTTEIAVEVELFLQLHQLSTGIGCADSLGSWARRALVFTVLSCQRERKEVNGLLELPHWVVSTMQSALADVGRGCCRMES